MTGALENSAEQKVGRVEIAISNLLRVGVISSLTIIFFGMILCYVHHPDAARDRDALAPLTSGTATFPHSLRDVFAGVANLRGQAVIAFGLLVLILTPVMRVAISIIVFAVQHDTAYVLITCVVLALLILSFILGHSGA